MAWYSSGTVALTANSTTVTGTGTQFLGNIRIGDGLVIAGSSALHEVTGISSDTQLTFQPAFAGEAGSGLNYAAVPVLGYDKDLSDAFNRLRLEIGDHFKNLQDLQDWVLDPTNTALDAAAAAESARDEAQTASTQAQAAEDMAAQQAGASETSRQAADTSRDAALAAAADAEASKDQAGVYEQQSGASAAASEASRLAAEQAVQEAEGLVPSETPGPGLVPKADASGALDAGWVPELENKVSKTSDTGAASLPVGTEAQRPTTPVNGMLRYNSEEGQFEGFSDGEWGEIGGSGGDALFSVEWWPKRSTVPAGYVPADGQLLNRVTFPDAAAGIDAGMMPVVTEAEWEADPLLRGSYTAGDGSTTFRLPDYNGQSAGAFGPLFLRGGASEGGVIQRDAMQRITGELGRVSGLYSASGAFTRTEIAPMSTSGTNYDSGSASFDSADSPDARTADETRPLNIGGVWVVKLFGAVVNEGSADAAQLATDVASLQGQAANAYRPSNIIGTVSQSGGVPTGALVEYGSNSNGQYWRYAGGMQVSLTRFIIRLDTAAFQTVTLPVSFIPDLYGAGVGYISFDPNPLTASAQKSWWDNIHNVTPITRDGGDAQLVYRGSLVVVTGYATLVCIGRWH